ncbi:bifunctional lysylphosphatidylglycerol flippase/synthetase MprF [Curtobacterium sp. RRHDQ10]|uniref:bifunctional lysylphosphatidylglycerol flippase/synthetase MprF n=1 Tax=Curtobacterium phyllosphaerae TaxID=3413379 RepID=UPI003BF00CCC
MQFSVQPVVAMLRARPLTTIVAVAGTALVVGATAVSREPDLHMPIAPPVVLVLTVIAFWFAERALGIVTTLLVAVLVPALASLASIGVIAVGSAVGEAHADIASGEPVWTPSLVAAALFAATAPLLPAGRRRHIRVSLWTVSLVMVLFAAHASDLARLLAVTIGALVGAAIGPRATVTPRRRVLGRDTFAAIQAAAGLGALATLVVHEPDGVLSTWAFAFPDRLTVFIAILLLVSAVLIARGRRSGLLLSIALQVLIAAVLATQLVIDPILDDDFQWAGADPAVIEWQLTLIAAWTVPAAVAIALVVSRRRLLRRAFLPRDDDHGALRELVRTTDAGSIGHMGLWRGNDVWFVPDGSGAVAFRVVGGMAITVSDPACQDADRERVIGAFVAHCEHNGWVPVFYSVHEHVRDLLDAEGWASAPVAAEAVIDAQEFSLAGKRRQDLRTATNRAGREGIRAVRTTFRELSPAHRDAVEMLCVRWADGRQLPEMGFTLGSVRELDDEDVALVLAVDDRNGGRVLAVTSWLPVYRGGQQVGITLDVMRRADDAMPGVVEFLIASAVLAAKDAGLAAVSLSGTPLMTADDDRRSWHDVVLRCAARALEPVYGFRSLRRFKDKFEPRHETLWMAIPSAAHLPAASAAIVRAYVPDLRVRHVLRLTQRRAATRGPEASVLVGARG